MDVPDWLIVYAILGMAIQGCIFYDSFLKLPTKYGYTERLVMTLIMWLLSSAVWPAYLFYALFIYKSPK
jgi:hypothetical protein